MGQIGQILVSAKWAEHPAPMETCDMDVDYDGMNECILANNSIFAIIEPEGGYIPFMFSIDDHGMHQIIGPTWEFMVGLSDPSTWDPALGLRGDPAQILGAFMDSFSIWKSYDYNLMDNYIIMYDGELPMRKSVYIYPNGLHIDILNSSKSITNLSIPLVLDPWLRYTSGWGDLFSGIESQFVFQWGINSGETVEIRSNNPVWEYTFNATRAKLTYPEDPNYDYSLGHYLPYPMALAEISSTENYFVDIILNP